MTKKKDSSQDIKEKMSEEEIRMSGIRDTQHRERLGTIVAVAFAVVCGVAVTIIGHFFYESRSSSKAAQYTVEAFSRQYDSGIYAYRILLREALLLTNDWLFDGKRLFLARALLNGIALILLNFAVLALAGRYRISEAKLRVVLMTDLFVLLCLYVNSNPYTVSVVAIIYYCIYLSEVNAPWVLCPVLIVGMLTHELAFIAVFYWLAQHLGTRQTWPDRTAVKRNFWPTAAITASGIGTYTALRLMVTPTMQPPTPFFQRFTGEQWLSWLTWVALLFLVGIWGAFINRSTVKRAIQNGRSYQLLFLATALPVGIYFALFASIWELRLFLPYFPMLILFSEADSERVESAPGQHDDTPSPRDC